ncbi:MAG: endonuclease [Pirellulaceae bacterium]|nr:endonuclease [Pirellulaceae bacterium]
MDGRVNLERTAAVIKRANPDLVALQEVDDKTTRSNGVDQTAELARLTKMHSAFGKAMDLQGGGYGVAVLSRFPLEEVKNHVLPHADRYEPRAALAALISPDDRTKLLFVATHLENKSEALRLQQVGALDNALAQHSEVPAILAGDLNAVPDSPTIAALSQHWTRSSSQDGAPTWPADKPVMKLDYVLFRPESACRVISSEVLNEVAASDHRPLLVVLEIASQSSDTIHRRYQSDDAGAGTSGAVAFKFHVERSHALPRLSLGASEWTYTSMSASSWNPLFESAKAIIFGDYPSSWSRLYLEVESYDYAPD